jgi:hypothetical protein
MSIVTRDRTPGTAHPGPHMSEGVSRRVTTGDRPARGTATMGLTWTFTVELRGIEPLTSSMPWAISTFADVRRCASTRTFVI